MDWDVAIYVGLLKGVRYLHNLFNILCGATQIEYNGRAMTIFDIFFTASPAAAVFWGITVIGLALAVIFSIVVVGRRMADLNAEKSLGHTIGHIGKTMLMFLITPLMMLSVFSITSVVMMKADDLFYSAAGGGTLDSTIFSMTAKNAALELPAFGKEPVHVQFAQETLNYDNSLHINEYLYQDNIMTWLGIPVSLILIVMYAICLMILSVRVFMLIILYMISPFFVSSMVLDDGRMYKAWRSSLFARLAGGFSLLISIKILTYIVVPFLIGDVALSRNIAGDITLKCLFAGGAVYAMYKSAGTLASIISPRTENDDAMIMGSIAGAVKGAAGAAVIAAKTTITMGVGAIRRKSRDDGGDSGGAGRDTSGAAGKSAGGAGGTAGNATEAVGV